MGVLVGVERGRPRESETWVASGGPWEVGLDQGPLSW